MHIDKLPHTKKEQVYQWVKRYVEPPSSVGGRLINNNLAWFLFVDSRNNESTKQHIKEFLLSSFVFKMTDTYVSVRLSKFKV